MIEQIYDFVTSNWSDIVQAYLALIGFASIVVKLTPTVKDDSFLKRYLRFTGKFIALNRK